MKVELKERGKGWGKALAACILFLAIAVFFLAMGIANRDVVVIVVGAIGTALLGALAVMMANPNMLSCMQVVKGEITYKELKTAVESEDFENPIRFFHKDGCPELFLVSENWAVFDDHANRVYVPKSKVRKIELMMELVELGPEYSGDGRTYLHHLYYFKFTCDEKHAFATGLIWHDRLERAMRIVQGHFPHVPIEQVSEPQEWKQ